MRQPDTLPQGIQPPRLLPPHYFLAALALMAALRGLGGAPVLAAPWPLLGLLPVALGLLVAVQGSRLFARAGTNIVPFTESATLVTNGVFAWSRNPMYLGMLLVLGGAAVLLNTWLPYLVLPAFYTLLRVGFVRVEERLMEATFGEEYLDYRSRVRRWC